MFGLICNEFIMQSLHQVKHIFDWNDIVWTLMGGGVFLIDSQKN